MSSAPDPSQPDQFEQRVKQIITQYLSDPLGYPPAMTTWLATFVSMNAPPPPPPPVPIVPQ